MDSAVCERILYLVGPPVQDNGDMECGLAAVAAWLRVCCGICYVCANVIVCVIQ